ncbi:MAG: hypothetical protein V4594_18290 [Bacteroidota bacterium]
MKNQKVYLVLSACILLGCSMQARAQLYPVSHTPVFKVDVPNPTMDKPQSKLWYMDGQWWALLPKSSGPSLWQRTAKGWTEDANVTKALSGNPGRVDVCVSGHQVMAVGTGTKYLMVYQLTMDHKSWQAEVTGRLLAPNGATGQIETATIVCDGSGVWWVAADFGEKVYVWSSADGRKWKAAVELGDKLNSDDISTLAKLPQGIGLIWSDQNQDAVKFRFHSDQKNNPGGEWTAEEMIDQGNRTADDHLHAALGQDGTLWLATKNSVDQIGKPQLVLRVRKADGKWKNYPFADLDSVKGPSRPVVFTIEGSGRVLVGYTEYNAVNTNLGNIKFALADTAKKGLLSELKTVVLPKLDMPKNTFRVNDITGPKSSFPGNGPWIILSSDQLGNIYEVDLRKLFGKSY